MSSCMLNFPRISSSLIWKRILTAAHRFIYLVRETMNVGYKKKHGCGHNIDTKFPDEYMSVWKSSVSVPLARRFLPSQEQGFI
jgi:hypothetical protein